MVSVCLYFQVHQPNRLRHYTVFDMYHNHHYHNDSLNAQILKKVATKCYLPTNALLEKMIRQYSGRFNLSFSLSGVLIEQLKRFSPETLTSFKRLADTGCVEFINETYYHSLSFVYSEDEFEKQVLLHRDLIKQEFGEYATTFRNTELIYNNDLAQCVSRLGYQVILAEGADKILQGRSPNYIYKPLDLPNIKLLLKNYRLSDDIAFRFSDRTQNALPLTAERYAHWICEAAKEAQVINLFMDYETFGEHHWKDNGIFEFLNDFPNEIFKHSNIAFEKPSTVAKKYSAVDEIDSPEFYSWADTERDLSAWSGNDLQQHSLMALYALKNKVYQTRDKHLIRLWQELQTSDHFYYMSTKNEADGEVHNYFSPYPDPYLAYITFQNILTDFSKIIEKRIILNDLPNLVSVINH